MFIEYKNVEIQQNANALSVFQKFLNHERFHTIIEIGTRYGGFTRLLKDISPYSRVLTFDIEDQKPPALDMSGIEVRIKNIFNEDFSQIIDDEVRGLIEVNEKNLILCDGGNKIKEFNCFAQYLKIGDIMMAHDYSKSWEYFNSNIKNKVWDWCEVTEDDISECSLKYNLVHYNQQEFQKAVWVCKIKVA